MKQHILITDDNDMDRLRISRFVASMGYVPVPAASGTEALNIIKTYPLAAMMLDIQMPKLNGFQVLEQLKASSENRAIGLPIVMMTTTLDEAEKVYRAVRLGAKDFVVKPVDYDILQSKLGHLLGTKADDWPELTLDSFDQRANVTEPVEMLSIGEMGIKMRMIREIPDGTFLRVDSPLFRDVEVGEMSLRAVSCRKFEDEYIVEFSLLGVTEFQRTKLRQLVQKLRTKART